MTDGSDYGLGLQLHDHERYGVYGHGGAIAGYQTGVLHSPELGVAAFVVSIDSYLDPAIAHAVMLDGFSALSQATAG